MAGTSTIIATMAPTDYLNAQQAYNLNSGTDLMLEQSREVMLSAGYFWLGVPVPGLSGIQFAGRDSKEFTVSAEPSAFLISICGFSDQDAGFSLNIMDKGSKTKVFTTAFAKSTHIAPVCNSNVVENAPTGPYYLTSPYPLTIPGQVQVQITNLSANNAIIQVLLNFAVKYKATSQHGVVNRVDQPLPVTQIPWSVTPSGKEQRQVSNMPIVFKADR